MQLILLSLSFNTEPWCSLSWDGVSHYAIYVHPGHAIYLGFIYMEALQNNHIAHVFVDLLWAAGKKQQVHVVTNTAVQVSIEGQCRVQSTCDH